MLKFRSPHHPWTSSLIIHSLFRSKTQPFFYPTLLRTTTTTTSSSFSSLLTSTPTPTSTSTSTSPSTSTFTSTSPLSTSSFTWPMYFQARLQRHRRLRFFNVVGLPLGLIGGIVGFAHQVEVDPTAMILGMEAPLVYSMVALGIGVVSAILTPISFESLWRVTHLTKAQQIDQLDKLFYQRIRKYRADPSLSLIGNQVYDYYGEKINSLSGYRTWLRKQRLLKEKATIKLGAGNEKPIEIPLT